MLRRLHELKERFFFYHLKEMNECISCASTFLLSLHALIKVKVNKPLTDETPIFSALLFKNVTLLVVSKQENTICIVVFRIFSFG